MPQALTRRALVLLFLVACGARGAPPGAVTPAPAASASSPTNPTRPVAPSDDAELGALVTEQGTKLDDHGVFVARGDFVEIDPTGVRIRVGRGDVELATDRVAVSRDAQDRFRVRAITPRDHPLGRAAVTLSLGDRAVLGEWAVRWIGIREGLVAFEGTHRKKLVERWTALLERRPNKELASAEGLFHFEVKMTALSGDPAARGGSVSVSGDTVERAAAATFGQSLAPGLYLFPDGLRMRVEQTAGCDFDPSEPCFGGTYRADAVFREQAARVEWRTRTTKILGHAVELASARFVVRK